MPTYAKVTGLFWAHFSEAERGHLTPHAESRSQALPGLTGAQ